MAQLDVFPVRVTHFVCLCYSLCASIWMNERGISAKDVFIFVEDKTMANKQHFSADKVLDELC